MKYIRIYADPAGDSHFKDVEKRQFFTTYHLLRLPVRLIMFPRYNFGQITSTHETGNFHQEEANRFPDANSGWIR